VLHQWYALPIYGRVSLPARQVDLAGILPEALAGGLPCFAQKYALPIYGRVSPWSRRVALARVCSRLTGFPPGLHASLARK